MAKAACAPFGFGQRCYLAPFWAYKGLNNKLRNALPVRDCSFFPASIQDKDKNFSSIVRVNQPHTLGDDQAIFCSKAASAVYKSGKSPLEWQLASWKGKFFLKKAPG